jgi:HEAT repeat protein
MKNTDVAEVIVRAVSVPWAKNVAVEPLIKRLKMEKGSENKSLAWAIGNALYVVATKSNADELLEIINDNTYKNARQMIILKIGIMKIRQSEDILIQLLSDEGVRGHAIAALGYLGSLKSKPYIQNYINHSNKWIQTESRKAINRINKINNINE